MQFLQKQHQVQPQIFLISFSYDICLLNSAAFVYFPPQIPLTELIAARPASGVPHTPRQISGYTPLQRKRRRNKTFLQHDDTDDQLEAGFSTTLTVSSEAAQHDRLVLLAGLLFPRVDEQGDAGHEE